MITRRRKALTAVSAFVAFSFAQVYVQAGLPNSPPGGQPRITARLTTKGNLPITVNNNSVGSGGTIVTGSTIETPDQVSAIIEVGDNVIELAPNSKIQLDFDQNGNVRVKVLRGCVAGKKKANVLAGQQEPEIELYTDTDSRKTDKKRRNVAGCYLPNGQLGGFGGGVGLTNAEWGAVAGGGIGVAVLAAVLLNRGNNPSPSQ